jgi:hypothetical protein
MRLFYSEVLRRIFGPKRKTERERKLEKSTEKGA